MMKDMSPFDTANGGYAIEGEEETCGDPDDAVAEYIDGRGEYGDSLATVIKSCAPLTVIAYDTDEVSDAWLVCMSVHLVRRLADEFSTDFGDPDSQTRDGFTSEAIERAALLLKPILRDIVEEYGHVSACHEVARRTYSSDEILAIMGPDLP